MYNIVSKYVNVMTKEDIINFANKNNLNVSSNEINFVYDFIKQNYEYFLKNPKSFDLSNYKDKFSNENYLFLEKLINKYKKIVL